MACCSRSGSSEIEIRSVSAGQNRLSKRPINVKGWVVPTYSACKLRAVGFRDHVEDVAVVFERLKAVRKALRYVEKPAVFGGNFESYPSPEGRRVPAQVKNDIVNSSPRAGYELCLFVRLRLKMHPTQRAPTRVRG